MKLTNLIRGKEYLYTANTDTVRVKYLGTSLYYRHPRYVFAEIENGKYGFLTEKSVIQYIEEISCNTIQTV